MTNKDKEEIRQIIKDELDRRFIGQCNHEWVTDYTSTANTTKCRKCGNILLQFRSIPPGYINYL